MLFILQICRYSSMLLLIFLILVQSPNLDGVNLNRTTKYLTNMRSTENILNRITWILVLIFLVSTICLASMDV